MVAELVEKEECCSGYLGENCTICDLECQKGGYCDENVKEAKCVCPPEWSGDLCQTRKYLFCNILFQ